MLLIGVCWLLFGLVLVLKLAHLEMNFDLSIEAFELLVMYVLDYLFDLVRLIL